MTLLYLSSQKKLRILIKRVNKGDEKHEEETEEASNHADEEATKPTSANTVAEIKAYLDAKGIDYTGKTKKEDLLALVK